MQAAQVLSTRNQPRKSRRMSQKAQGLAQLPHSSLLILAGSGERVQEVASFQPGLRENGKIVTNYCAIPLDIYSEASYV